MPAFNPQYINAVILFGEKACNRFASMLNYWQTILNDSSWDHYLFLCVCPGEWRFPSAEELSPSVRKLASHDMIRCLHISPDPADKTSWQLPRKFLEQLKMKLHIGKVMLHCVCDDLSDDRLDPEIAVQMLSSARSYLGAGNSVSLYYLVLREHKAARLAQRRIAQKISDNQTADTFTYLLSRTANDGSLLPDFVLWRALMCEILVSSSGQRMYTPSRLYTLGYNSLNASDNELVSLRNHFISNVLLDLHNEPMSTTDAWMLLTCGRCPAMSDYSTFAIESAISSWLTKLADDSTFRPSPTDLKNIRALSGLTKAGESSGIPSIVNRFFEINIGTRLKSAARQRVSEHLNAVLQALCMRIDLPTFPLTILDAVIATLKTLSRPAGPVPLPQPPAKKLLQKHEDYLDQYAALVASAVRTTFVRQQTAALAACFLTGFQQLKDRLLSLSTKDAFNQPLQDFRLLPSDEQLLRDKYPKYSTTLLETIASGKLTYLGREWLTACGPLYNSRLQLQPQVLQALVHKGEQILHNNLPFDFRSTFIRTLHSELSTDFSMSAFLDKYLQVSRHMFRCVLDVPHRTPPTYFIDSDLAYAPWTNNHINNAVIVENDNIEQLVFVMLEHDLTWFLALQEGNDYFGEHEELFSFSEGGTWNSWGSSFDNDDDEQPAEEVFTTEQTADENPRNITLTETGDGRFLLTWDWEGKTPSMLVRINDDAATPCAVAEYHIIGGYDVTSRIVYGRNKIQLNRLDLSSYGNVELAGRKHTVRYRFIPESNGTRQLKLDGRVSANSSLMIEEKRPMGEGRFYCLYYPVAPNGCAGVALYKGLALSGTCRLCTLPSDAFPTIKPVQDINL